MIVRLPERGIVPVDSKVPLDAFLKAMEADSDEERKVLLAQHAQAFRARMRELSQRSYWAQFETMPEVVVMFVPVEASVAAAFLADRDLFEDAFQNKVLITSPISLFALLKAVAFGWQQQQVAENAKEIAAQGKTVYERLTGFFGHLSGVGKSLEASVKKYNEAMGSLDARLMPAARKLREMGVAPARSSLRTTSRRSRGCRPAATIRTWCACLTTARSDLKKIAVLTSGGDAPGMNAAVRAVTRGALAKGWQVFAVRNGYAGLLAGTIEPLAARDVGGIVQQGGTVLGSARCPEFVEPAGRRKALSNLEKLGDRGAGGDRRQRLADRLGQPGARGLSGGRRAFHHRQRPLRHRRQHRRRHRDQRHARGDRPPAHHRLVAPARLRRRDHGPRLRLHRADGRHRRRRRGDRAARERDHARRSRRAAARRLPPRQDPRPRGHRRGRDAAACTS